MALSGAEAVNAAGSKVTVAERWIKMYRKIHNLFLKEDFTNRKDFEFTHQQLNLRIDNLEAQLNAAITALNSSVTQLTTHANSHTHTSPQAPAGILVTGPGGLPVPAVPGPPAVPPKTLEAQTTTINVETRDLILQGSGEPVVPLDTTGSL